MLLQSNQGIEPTWLLRETGTSALEADPRVPPYKKKHALKKLKSAAYGMFMLLF